MGINKERVLAPFSREKLVLCVCEDQTQPGLSSTSFIHTLGQNFYGCSVIAWVHKEWEIWGFPSVQTFAHKDSQLSWCCLSMKWLFPWFFPPSPANKRSSHLILAPHQHGDTFPPIAGAVWEARLWMLASEPSLSRLSSAGRYCQTDTQTDRHTDTPQEQHLISRAQLSPAPQRVLLWGCAAKIIHGGKKTFYN